MVPLEERASLLSTLWLDAGPEFLREQHDALARAIGALQDAAAGDTVIDLREEVAVDRSLRCHRHLRSRAHVRCRDCSHPFCNDCVTMVDAAGLALCQDCALVAAGIRPARRRPMA